MKDHLFFLRRRISIPSREEKGWGLNLMVLTVSMSARGIYSKSVVNALALKQTKHTNMHS